MDVCGYPTATGCGDFVDKSGFDERKYGVHHAMAPRVPLPVPHTGSSCLWTSLVHSLPTPPPQHKARLMNTSEPGLGRREGMPLYSDLSRVLVLYHPGVISGQDWRQRRRPVGTGRGQRGVEKQWRGSGPAAVCLCLCLSGQNCCLMRGAPLP